MIMEQSIQSKQKAVALDKTTEKSSSMTHRLLSLAETAAYLGLSVRTLYNRCGRKSKHPLPFRVKRIGKLVKVDIHELEKYVESI